MTRRSDRTHGALVRWSVVGLLATVLLGAGMAFMTHMPGRSHRGALPPLTPEAISLRTRLQGHVKVLAGDIGERGERIAAMLSLETLGYYISASGSQRYSNSLYRLFYPDRGDFLAFVSNLDSRPLVRTVIEAFRRHTAFPSEGVAAPGWWGGVHWSDHWSFWREGYPALMVTDTALYRYRYYHTAGDTPDQLDYESLARVAAGLARVVAELAQ